MKTTRKIVEIDEELCNGCGQCLPNCAEGAMYLENGKAKLKADKLCDGLGACLGHCPMGALKIVERYTDEFDEEAVHQELEAMKKAEAAQTGHGGCGCAGSKAMSLERPAGGCPGSRAMHLGAVPGAGPGHGAVLAGSAAGFDPAGPRAGASGLGHWPVKLRLIPPDAPFLRGAELVIAADCAPVALPDFNSRLAGKVVAIACPKFDDPQPYMNKLVQMFRGACLKKVSVVRMEVPCCTGLSALVHQAAQLAGTGVPVEDAVVTRMGELVSPDNIPGMGRAL